MCQGRGDGDGDGRCRCGGGGVSSLSLSSVLWLSWLVAVVKLLSLLVVVGCYMFLTMSDKQKYY
jgi:hypothetical protein